MSEVQEIARDISSVRARRGIDFRLLIPALGLWFGIVLGIIFRSWSALLCIFMLVVVGMMLLRGCPFFSTKNKTQGIEGRKVLGTMIVGVLSVLLGASYSTWRMIDIDQHPWAQVVQEGAVPMEARLSILAMPRPLPHESVMVSVVVKEYWFKSHKYMEETLNSDASRSQGLGSMTLFLRVEDMELQENPREHSSLVKSSQGSQEAKVILNPGAEIIIPVLLKNTGSGMIHPYQMESRGKIRDYSPPQRVWQWGEKMRHSLAASLEGDPQAAQELIPALVLGDISRQGEDMKRNFKAAGLSHLMAVSGANVAMVLGFLWGLFRMVRLSRSHALIGSGVGLIGYLCVVGPEPSVLRAGCMGMIGLMAILHAHRTHGVTAVGAAIIIILPLNIEMAVHYGFLLSVVATLAIVLGTEQCTKVFAVLIGGVGALHNMPRGVWIILSIIAVSLCADIVTAPVVSMMTGFFIPFSLLSNVMVTVVIAPITVLGLLASVVGLVNTDIAGWILFPASVAARGVVLWAEYMADFPVLHADSSLSLGIVIVSVSGIILWWIVVITQIRRGKQYRHKFFLLSAINTALAVYVFLYGSSLMDITGWVHYPIENGDSPQPYYLEEWGNTLVGKPDR